MQMFLFGMCVNFTCMNIDFSDTILQRKKKSVKIDKVEIPLILRSYITHPTKWTDIIENIKQNADQLPSKAKELYLSATRRQLRDRVSVKMSKLLAAQHIADADVR